MTPKQKYHERKRLRLENDLRAEQRRGDKFDHENEMEFRFMRILCAVERIADVMELWADQQVENGERKASRFPHIQLALARMFTLLAIHAVPLSESRAILLLFSANEIIKESQRALSNSGEEQS